MCSKPADKPNLAGAFREMAARLESGWESDKDYTDAIKAAVAGDRTRLANRLRARLPLSYDDFEALAAYVERDGAKKRRRGAPKNDLMRECLRVVEILKEAKIKAPETALAKMFGDGADLEHIIDYACQSVERLRDDSRIDREKVRDWTRRPKTRRQ